MTVAMTWRCPVCQLDFDEPFCDQCAANLMTMPAVVCAWCSRTVREGAEPVSHGICEDCKESLSARVYA